MSSSPFGFKTINDQLQTEATQTFQSEESWFGYPEKVRPGSRDGRGGRIKTTEPSWKISQKVRDELKGLKVTKTKFIPDHAVNRLNFIVNRSKHSETQRFLEENRCFCRKVSPHSLDFRELFGSLSGEIPISKDLSYFVLCSESEAHFPIILLGAHNCDVVLVGNRVPVNIENLSLGLPFVHNLVLCRNGFKSFDANQLFLRLKDNQSVRSVSVVENLLGDNGCAAVPDCLHFNDHITSLRLSLNGIGNEGTKIISEGLLPCKCLDLMTKAIREDQLHVFVLLLKHGYPLGSIKSSLEQMSTLSVESGSVLILNYLVDLDDEFHSIRSKMGILLSRAASLGQIKILEVLLARNADVMFRNSEGRSALMEASANGNCDIVGTLLRTIKRKQVDLEICVRGLELFPDINHETSIDKTRKNPTKSWLSLDSMSASTVQDRGKQEGNLSSVFRGLTSRFRQPGAKTAVDGVSSQAQNEKEIPLTASDLILRIEVDAQSFSVPIPNTGHSFNFAMKHFLKFEKLDFSTCDREIIFRVIQSGSDDCSILGEGKAEIPVLAFDHTQELEIWCYVRAEEVVVACINLAVKAILPHLNEKSKVGNTALIEAVKNGHLNVVELLAKNGADVNATDLSENTPLITASRLGRTEMVKQLLRCRADVAAKNRTGMKPLMAAQQFGHSQIVQILQGHDMAKSNLPLSVKRWHIDAASKPAGRNDLFIDYKSTCLHLTVVEARNLPVADVTGLSDPFCRVTLNNQEKKTRVLHRNLNPRWNQSFVFDDQFLSVWEKSELLLEVFDSNFTTSATFLGRKKIKMTQLISLQGNQIEDWISCCFYLEDESGLVVRSGRTQDSVEAKIQIRFKFLPASGRFLRVGVLKAANLPLVRTRQIESFCVVQYGDQTVESPMIPRNTNLSWDFYANMRAETLDQTLTVELFDVKTGLTLSSSEQARLVGRLEIPPVVLEDWMACRLNNTNFEMFGADGISVKGPGGHISSIFLDFAVTGSVGSDAPLHHAGFKPDQESSEKAAAVREISSQTIHQMLERRGKYPAPCLPVPDSALETDKSPWSESQQAAHAGETSDPESEEAVCRIRQWEGAGGVMLFNPDHSSITAEELQSIPLNHTKMAMVHLVLDQNMISDQGATSLAGVLIANDVLKSLSVRENKIGCEGATALGKSLQLNCSLTQFNISKNRIKDEGLREICRALESNKKNALTSLDVGENCIGSVGMRFLAKMFVQNNVLEALAVRSNCIGGDGLLLLAQGLRRSLSIRELDIGNSVIGDIGVKILVQSLTKAAGVLSRSLVSNRSLRALNLASNNLTEQAAHYLMECLKHNRVLQRIIVDDNQISEQSAEALNIRLQQNCETALVEFAISRIQKAFRQARYHRLRKKATQYAHQAKKGTPPSETEKPHENSVPARANVSRGRRQSSGDAGVSVSEIGDLRVESLNSTHAAASTNLKDMLLTATSVTMYNLGDAVILEHEAACAMIQESAAELLAAAERYSSLESRFFELLSDENVDQQEVVSALNQLTMARAAIFRAVEESKQAEEAAAKCFKAAEVFARCESEEAEMVDTITEDPDANLHSGRPASLPGLGGIADVHGGDIAEAPGPLTASHRPQGDVSNAREALDSGEAEDSRISGGSADEDAIRDAFKEFLPDDVEKEESFTQDEVEAYLDEYEKVRQELLRQRQEEIEACCALALQELEICNEEIADLKQRFDSVCTDGLRH